MRRTTKKVRQIAEVEKYRVQYEMRKHMDEKTKNAIAYGHRKPYAPTLHGEREERDEKNS